MTYSRRDFLKSMVGASSFLSLAPTFPAFLQQAAAAAESNAASGETVLVVLQLSGGNDGLNTRRPLCGRRLRTQSRHLATDRVAGDPDRFVPGFPSGVEGVSPAAAGRHADRRARGRLSQEQSRSRSGPARVAHGAAWRAAVPHRLDRTHGGLDRTARRSGCPGCLRRSDCAAVRLECGSFRHSVGSRTRSSSFALRCRGSRRIALSW